MTDLPPLKHDRDDRWLDIGKEPVREMTVQQVADYLDSTCDGMDAFDAQDAARALAKLGAIRVGGCMKWQKPPSWSWETPDGELYIEYRLGAYTLYTRKFTIGHFVSLRAAKLAARALAKLGTIRIEE